jgi:hypothetical protein
MTRTISLLDALYVTSSTRALRVIASEPQEKLPESRRSARNFMLPPRQRTGRTSGWLPLHSLVFAAGRPSSYLRVHAKDHSGGRSDKAMGVKCALGASKASLITRCMYRRLASSRACSRARGAWGFAKGFRGRPGERVSHAVREGEKDGEIQGTHLRFLRHGLGLPPVPRRLWSESREMPARAPPTHVLARSATVPSSIAPLPIQTQPPPSHTATVDRERFSSRSSFAWQVRRGGWATATLTP